MNSEKLSKLQILIQNSSIHGLSNIFLSKRKFNKFSWLMLFIVFSILVIIFVKNAISHYFNFEVITEIKVITKNELEFPAITFCYLELCGIDSYEYNSYLKKYKLDEETNNDKNIDNEIDHNLKFQNIKTNLFLAKEIFLRKYNPESLEKVLKNTTELLEFTLINCSFGNSRCNHTDFNFVEMSEFKKCYSFNSGFVNKKQIPIKKINVFDKIHGFKIELNLENNKSCRSPLAISSGLEVYIHEPSYNLDEDDDAILVKPNTEVDISLELTSVKKLSKPYSDCYKNLDSKKIEKSSLIFETNNLTSTYTQQYCLKLCYQKYLIENCNCFETNLPNYSPLGITKCTKFIDSLYTCQYLTKKLFYNGKNDQDCLSKCPKGLKFL